MMVFMWTLSVLWRASELEERRLSTLFKSSPMISGCDYVKGRGGTYRRQERRLGPKTLWGVRKGGRGSGGGLTIVRC